jgi:hypothetical protein
MQNTLARVLIVGTASLAVLVVNVCLQRVEHVYQPQSQSAIMHERVAEFQSCIAGLDPRDAQHLARTGRLALSYRELSTKYPKFARAADEIEQDNANPSQAADPNAARIGGKALVPTFRHPYKVVVFTGCRGGYLVYLYSADGMCAIGNADRDSI